MGYEEEDYNFFGHSYRQKYSQGFNYSFDDYNCAQTHGLCVRYTGGGGGGSGATVEVDLAGPAPAQLLGFTSPVLSQAIFGGIDPQQDEPIMEEKEGEVTAGSPEATEAYAQTRAEFRKTMSVEEKMKRQYLDMEISYMESIARKCSP